MTDNNSCIKSKFLPLQRRFNLEKKKQKKKNIKKFKIIFKEDNIKEEENFFKKNIEKIWIKFSNNPANKKKYKYYIKPFKNFLKFYLFNKKNMKLIKTVIIKNNSLDKIIKLLNNITYNNKIDYDNYNENTLLEGKEFKTLKNNKIPLTKEERAEVISKKAIWHNRSTGKTTSAIWKGKDSRGTIWYITNTHRAYQKRPTLKGAINIFHKFIKGTA